MCFFFFFFQAEDGIRDLTVTGVQTCALPIFTAESDGIGKGTTFTITLPLLAVRVEPAELHQLRGKPEMPKLNGLKVLVVDDDDEAGSLVALVLGQLGADAQAVTSVAAAVKMLRSFQADVVVSYIAM